MAGRAVTTLKFVGTIGLGLLTGVSYTISTLTLPSLLTLPTAQSAHSTFLYLQTLVKNNLRALTALSFTSLSFAYALSPRGSRHPYLLWTALTAALGGGVDFALRHDEDKLRQRNGNGISDADIEEGYAGMTESDVGLGGHGINGEEVKEAMTRLRIAEAVRGGVSGLAFAMAVVGIWGDGA